MTHLHCHSSFSMLDGASLPEQMVSRLLELGHDACAVTDHGNVYAHRSFDRVMRAASLKPIFGLEAYQVAALRDTSVKKATDDEKTRNHVTLLAGTEAGYVNLLKLNKLAYEHHYNKPVITWEMIARHQEGLVVLSGCVAGDLSRKLIAGYDDEALELMRWCTNNISRYYAEIIPCPSLDFSLAAVQKIHRMARELSVPIVLTNDAHFSQPLDHDLEDVLVCIGINKRVSDPDRKLKLPAYHYMCDHESLAGRAAECVPEMTHKDIAAALMATHEISESINFELPIARKAVYPISFEESKSCPTSRQQLLSLINKGKKKRFKQLGLSYFTQQIQQEYDARVDYEMSVIGAKDFEDYFLIVADIVRYVQSRREICAARGSAAGSLVCWLLEITQIDPVRFELPFERFMNPDRADYPDIDLDFPNKFRAEIFTYLTEKYGKDYVGHVAALSYFRANQAIIDVGKAYDVPFSLIRILADSVPKSLGADGPVKTSGVLKHHFADCQSIQWILEKHPEMRMAERVEGQIRHSTIHAAGYVVAGQPIVEVCGVGQREGALPIIQADKEDVASAGLLKIDVLSLDTLGVVSEVLLAIGKDLDWLLQVPLDDQATYDMLSRGEATAIFQLQGTAASGLMRQLRPKNLDDIAAISVLARPGPLQSGGAAAYIEGYHGRSILPTLHPLLAAIVCDTFGQCIAGYETVILKNGTSKIISEVNGGDVIMTLRDGLLVPSVVRKQWSVGVKKTVKITLVSGQTIVCTPEHRFPTVNGDVMAGDMTCGRSGDRLYQAWSMSNSKTDARVSLDQAYFLGLWLGDGCHADSIVVCAGDEEETADQIAEIYEMAFPGGEARKYFSTRAWYVYRCYNTQPRRTSVVQWLDEIYGSRAWKGTCRIKHLPTCCFDWSEEQRLELLRGLWDADGTYLRDTQFTGSSALLLSGVSRLLSTLKIQHGINGEKINVIDRKRFWLLLGGPRLATKLVYPDHSTNMVPVSTRELQEELVSRGDTLDKRARMALRQHSYLGPQYGSAVYISATSLQRSYEAVYARTYLGDARPVAIKSIEEQGEQECFDLEMEDQSNPYFLVNNLWSHNCIYQEQIMAVAREVGGFSWGDVHKIRKMITSTSYGAADVQKYLPAYLEGAAQKGVPTDQATWAWNQCEKAGGYVFNKAHAYSYAMIGYWTSYLKCHYPAVFTAVAASHTDDDTTKIKLLSEFRKSGGKIKLLHHTHSKLGFTAIDDTTLVGGFDGIVGVGPKTAEKLISQQPYSSWEDFYLSCPCALAEKIKSTGVDHDVLDKTVISMIAPWFVETDFDPVETEFFRRMGVKTVEEVEMMMQIGRGGDEVRLGGKIVSIELVDRAKMAAKYGNTPPKPGDPTHSAKVTLVDDTGSIMLNYSAQTWEQMKRERHPLQGARGNGAGNTVMLTGGISKDCARVFGNDFLVVTPLLLSTDTISDRPTSSSRRGPSSKSGASKNSSLEDQNITVNLKA